MAPTCEKIVQIKIEKQTNISKCISQCIPNFWFWKPWLKFSCTFLPKYYHYVGSTRHVVYIEVNETRKKLWTDKQ
jgi:hypothetical protein